jgi:NAD(P)H-dependent flavin oxidoreductase YrpB (nitropropane dioxygenase family)
MSWISTPELVAAVSNAGAHAERGFVPRDDTHDVLANSTFFVRAFLN